MMRAQEPRGSESTHPSRDGLSLRLRWTIAGSLVSSLILLILAHLLTTVMRPSLFRPWVYFLYSASTLLFFASLAGARTNRFIQLASRCALVVESAHLALALLMLSGRASSLLAVANANWYVDRALLVLVLVALRVHAERANAARAFQAATSAAIILALFAVFPTPALFYARAVALIVFYTAALTTRSAPIPADTMRTQSLSAGVWIFACAMGATSATMSLAAYRQPPERVWTTIPRVLLSGKDGDARADDVAKAVAFWNFQLRRLGSDFQLGAVSATDALTALDRKAVEKEDLQAPTRSRLAGLGSSIVVVLSDGPLVSFVHERRVNESVVVVITSALASRPDIRRNVIAHEIGHAIGLRHNDDAGTLMCGAPAPCAVNRFGSARGQLFPLGQNDEAMLRRWYPPTWTPRSGR